VSEPNQTPIDLYSFGHLAIGAGLGWAGVRPELAIGSAIAWELLENPLKARYPAIFPFASPDTAPNALLDVAAWMVGYYLASSLR
jgi:hypothetical protein